jgi:predicted nucleic acid-binding protein
MSEKATVYLETTIPSYLTARPSNDLITAGEQAITREWWEQRRMVYRLFISEAVVEEASRGDVEASRRRLEVLSGLEELAIDEPSISLAQKLLEHGLIPQKAAADAIHIAVAARHGVDYLLT